MDNLLPIIVIAIGFVIVLIVSRIENNGTDEKNKQIKVIRMLVLLLCSAYLLYDLNMDYNPRKLKYMSLILLLLLSGQTIKSIQELLKNKA